MTNIHDLAQELNKVRQEKNALEKRESALKNELLSQLSTGDTIYDDIIVSVKERATFNEKEATRNLSSNPDIFAKVSRPKVDSAMAKAYLDEDTYKLTCCTLSHTITVKTVTE